MSFPTNKLPLARNLTELAASFQYHVELLLRAPSRGFVDLLHESRTTFGTDVGKIGRPYAVNECMARANSRDGCHPS